MGGLLDYWKNWQTKITSFQTEKEVRFYTSGLRLFIDFVENYFRNVEPRDLMNTSKIMEQELKRLENISEEEFGKTDKWSNSAEWKEMSIGEISDFLEQVDNKEQGSSKNSPKKEINKSTNNHSSIAQQKNNDNNGVKKLGWFFGIVGFLGIIGVICFKRFS